MTPKQSAEVFSIAAHFGGTSKMSSAHTKQVKAADVTAKARRSGGHLTGGLESPTRAESVFRDGDLPQNDVLAALKLTGHGEEFVQHFYVYTLRGQKRWLYSHWRKDAPKSAAWIADLITTVRFAKAILVFSPEPLQSDAATMGTVLVTDLTDDLESNNFDDDNDVVYTAEMVTPTLTTLQMFCIFNVQMKIIII